VPSEYLSYIREAQANRESCIAFKNTSTMRPTTNTCT
jgi:hypothetical protein